MFTLYGALHLKSDIYRLYIPRKEGGRGLISIEDCVELAIRGVEVYVHKGEERLIQAARGDKIDGLEVASVLERSKKWLIIVLRNSTESVLLYLNKMIYCFNGMMLVSFGIIILLLLNKWIAWKSDFSIYTQATFIMLML